jgi:FMN phosphatase YigB (HAD superfamily)
VTREALDFALARSRSTWRSTDRERLRSAYQTLAPFPDAASALASVKPRPCWILSNGTLAMLEPLVARSGFAAHLPEC